MFNYSLTKKTTIAYVLQLCSYVPYDTLCKNIYVNQIKTDNKKLCLKPF